MRDAIKRADGSVQGLVDLPADVRELFRTAWELPQRALIDLAAARSPYIDQSQSLNLFLAAPTIGKLSSMYLLRLEVRAEDDVLPALAPGDAHPADADGIHQHAALAESASRAPWRTPRPARPANDHHRSRPRPTATPMLLDPGMDLTLRPMRYPHFYDRFRDAIKNTWTVEEVDLHSDLKDLQRLSPAEQHLVGRLVAFFATGDTIVANNLVLNLYQHVNSPEGAAVPVAPAVRGGACTSSST